MKRSVNVTCKIRKIEIKHMILIMMHCYDSPASAAQFSRVLVHNISLAARTALSLLVSCALPQMIRFSDSARSQRNTIDKDPCPFREALVRRTNTLTQ